MIAFDCLCCVVSAYFCCHCYFDIILSLRGICKFAAKRFASCLLAYCRFGCFVALLFLTFVKNTIKFVCQQLKSRLFNVSFGIFYALQKELCVF